ncbi:hypothetical protein [uncultured Sphingomonas sp.]|uniref:hypothetical protein n=1 Tax=uncultured Sphingomonas sp. TaxID=158754 RepID=UPI0035CA63F0
MARYAISYHFLDDAGAADRRASLLREIARCKRAWSDGGSLSLVETPEPIALLEARLYLDSSLNAVKDQLLVIELGDAAAGRGAFADRDGLRALLPGAAIA